MNYCGKECDACNKREELNCPGCYKGPGKPVTGDCAIARCCRERKISACAHCTSAGYCGMLKTGKDVEERLRQKEEQEARRQFLAEHSSVMGKWVGVLCWLVVPGLVHTVLKNLLPNAQGAAQVLEWIDLICTAVYGIILLYLGHKNTLYRRAGILALVSMVLPLLSVGLVLAGVEGMLLLFPIIGATVMIAVAEVSELGAHAAAVEPVDATLSAKWEKLRKWTLICYVGAAVSPLLALVPLLGILAVLAVIVGLVVVSIQKICYLFATAERFKKCAKSGY